MATYYSNTGKDKHRQHFYGLSTDTKPTTAYVGDRLYIIDEGLHKIWNGTDWVEYFTPNVFSKT